MALNCNINVMFKHSSVQLNDHNGFMGQSLVRSSAPMTTSSRSRSAASVIKCWKGGKPPAGVLEKLATGVDGTVVPFVPIPEPKTVTRRDFPTDFKFGCSTSAFQTEGKGDEGGRGPATWDFWITNDTSQPGLGMGTNSYNMYKEDVKLLKAMGVDVYRMSISWSRILPDGTISGGINQQGIDFYNNFFQELLNNGIKPIVTLFHFDLPLALSQKYGGFADKKIVDDFKAYADLCFKSFGDKVKYWGTINEPQVWGQYGDAKPNDAVSQLTCMHNILLAHGAAAKLYQSTYQASQKGEIGLSIQAQWFEPLSLNRKDMDASLRAFDFYTGWLLEPLVFGHYPFSMQALVRDKLPTFTDEEIAMVKGSYDYIGVNYYTSRYASGIPVDPNAVPPTSALEYQHADTPVEKDGKPIGEVTPGSAEIYLYPEGLTKTLIYMSKHYKNPKLYVTENGYPEKRDDTVPLQIALQDNVRIEHVRSHLYAVKQAMKEGANVKAYIMWALMDCLEMGSDYNVRYGLNYVDYSQGLKRYPKKSAFWLNSFLENK